MPLALSIAEVGTGRATVNVKLTSEVYSLPAFSVSTVREGQAAAINHQRTGANVLVLKSRDLLLQEIEKPAFALQRSKQMKRRCVLALRRHCRGFRGCFFQLNRRLGRLRRQVGIEQDSKRQANAREESWFL